MLKKVLVTGGAGFIGVNTIRYSFELGRNEFDWYIFDNLHPQVHKSGELPSELPPNVTFYKGDVTSAQDWDNLLRLVSPEIIIHLAAETGTGQSLTEANRHGRVNVVGTTEMIDALHRNNCIPQHIILTSSRAVYGDGEWRSKGGRIVSVGSRTHAELEAAQWDYIDEEHGLPLIPIMCRAGKTPPNPTNIYAATKLAQEHILRVWCTAFEVPLTILRLQNVYGPGQALENSYTGIVALFSRLAYEGKPIEVFEDGKIIRDFVYVRDVSQAIYKSLVKPPVGSTERLLDIGYGDATTVYELAMLLSSTAQSPAPIINGKYRDGDVRAAYCDISQAKIEIGYKPEWPLSHGLKYLYKWVQDTNGGSVS